MGFVTTIQRRWHEPEGYRRVLEVSLPLVASMASTTVMLFTDRMFLGRYSVEALAASAPAGIAAFTFQAFFMGVASYVNTFVAQYVGSDNPGRVGKALWQGIYFSIGAGFVLAGCALAAGPVFEFGGHAPDVRALEETYFMVLMLGGGTAILRDALACFFSGRGKTNMIMVVSLVGAGVNIPLDYALINGVFGFPELGILGAGIATITGYLIMVVLFIFLIFNRANDREFGVLRSWAFDPALFRRLLRFGGPAGIQFFMDLFSFSFFLLIVGRLGTVALAASNVAFAINTLGFLPMVGFSIGIATLVGQAMGRDEPAAARRATRNALHLTFAYMIFISLLLICIPGPLIELFRPIDESGTDYEAIKSMGIIILRFVAAYTFIDAINLVLSGTLKGAGDTKFVGWVIAIGSSCFLVLPVYVIIVIFNGGLYTAWALVTFYGFAVAVFFSWRYRLGAWETMRVIETTAHPVPSHPEVPGIDDVL
jgi:MATE family multidrug resistance protein